MTERDVSAYREALRALSLSDGFSLVPVEVRGGDVARDFARWLDAEGVSCALVEPTNDEAWRGLVADLFTLRVPKSGVAMVLGDRAATPAVVDALHLLNQRRDSLARSLGRPLLWCGPPEFIGTTWARAPDFWSIRALPIVVDARREGATVAPLWPALWVVDPPERLRAMLDAARRQGDRPNEGRVALSLTEALVARWQLGDALEVVDDAPRTPELTLVRGVIYAHRGATALARDCFLQARSDARTPDLRARVTLCLTNLEPAAPGARGEYEAARAAFAAEGDRGNEAVATANLGVVALAAGDATGAIDLLEVALEHARAAGSDAIVARVLTTLGAACLARRDSRRAIEALEEALVSLRTTGDRHGEIEALARVAEAYLNVGDPEKAARDAESALAIADAIGGEARGAAAIVERASRA